MDSTGQSFEFDMGKGNYMRDIARARTFGFTKDVEMLRTNGLALGGGLDNAIVMDDYKVLNSDGLRYDDEFVKHKILDAIGDLYVIGHPILGAYSAFRSGHGMNNQLIRAVLARMPTGNSSLLTMSAKPPQALHDGTRLVIGSRPCPA